MKYPKTYLITDGKSADDVFDESLQRLIGLARAAVQNGISYFQLREKNLNAANLFRLTKALANIVKSSSTRLLVNDRADIALAAGADGVHLTTRSMSVAQLRRSFGDRLIIFASTHFEAEIVSAAQQGADAVVLGPVFDTPGKGVPLGLNGLQEACAKFSPFEIIAIGGIDESNFRLVLDAGASGFAAIRGFDSAEKIEMLSNLLQGR